MGLGWLLTLAIQPAAAEPLACADVPARVCAFYAGRAKDRFIDLPDGTYVENPSFSEPAADPAPAASVRMTDEAVVGELMDLIDVPKLSTRTKLSLSMNAVELFDEGSDSVTLPWPLNGDRPQPRVMKRAEAFKALEAAVGRGRFNLFKNMVRDTQNKISLNREAARVAGESGRTRALREREQSRAADPARLAARETRVREIFARAKAAVIEIVTSGRAKTELNPEQLNLLTRLEGLEPKILTAAEADLISLCQDHNPNAFHNREAHDVRVCPATLWRPDADLAFVFGHEMAHAIDPCAVQNDLARWNPAALPKLTAAGTLSAPKLARVNEFIKTGEPFMSPVDGQFLDESATRASLVDADVLKIVTPRLNARPELYRKVSGCITERFGYREMTVPQQEQVLTQAHQNLGGWGGLSGDRLSEADARLRHYLEAHRDCPIIESPARSHVNEGLADVFGAVTKEKHQADHPPRSEAERMLSLHFGPGACDARAKYQADDVSPAEVMAYQREHRDKLDDDHPAAQKRLLMEMDLPGLAASFGCTRAQAGCFDHLSLIKPSAAPAGAGSTK